MFSTRGIIGGQGAATVACLCVTRGRPVLLRRAIDCYDAQTYHSRCFLAVAEADDAATRALLESLGGRPDIHRITVPVRYKLTLGELRNLAIISAQTDYVAQWDDDDFYHPNRLSVQMQAVIDHQKPACVLRRVMLIINGRQMISSVRNWEGTLLCRRSDMLTYPSLPRAEDTPVIDALAKARKLVRLDRPELYAYVYHGDNTWDAEHWTDFIRHGSEINRPEQQELLDMLTADAVRRWGSAEAITGLG